MEIIISSSLGDYNLMAALKCHEKGLWDLSNGVYVLYIYPTSLWGVCSVVWWSSDLSYYIHEHLCTSALLQKFTAGKKST